MAGIVILGAGELGGALARQLAAADLVQEIALVDDAGMIAAGKALDICQASPVDRYSTRVSGHTTLDVLVGATIIVMADRAGGEGGEWHGDRGLSLVTRIVGLNDCAPILCAGAEQGAIVDRAVREVGVPRSKIYGSAPEALRSAIVGLTALEAGCAPADICLTVVGRPPNHIIVPWEDASIAGRRATAVIPPPAITRLDGRLPRLWPPGPMTLASAAARTLRIALKRSRQAIAAFVSVSREEGEPGRVAMLPVTVHPGGIGGVIAPALSARDRVRLDTVLHS